jgi:hypothetical protein
MASQNRTILNPLFVKACRNSAFLFYPVSPWVRTHQSRCERTCSELYKNPIFKGNVNLPERACSVDYIMKVGGARTFWLLHVQSVLQSAGRVLGGIKR